MSIVRNPSLILSALLLSGCLAACGDDGSTPQNPSLAPEGGQAGQAAGGGGAGGVDNGGQQPVAGGSGGIPDMAVGGGGAGGGGAPSGGMAGEDSGGSGGDAAGGGGADNMGGAGGDAEGGQAGEGGAGGEGGAMEPEQYNPCPTNGDPCRIMPLGDSITDGVGSSHQAGYRPELFHLALTDGKMLTFVGSTQNGPNQVDGQPFPRANEGHSGWTIDDGGGREGLYPEIEQWFNANPPHIVTLMIGTNDVNIQLDLGNAANRLELLLDRIIEHAPDALIVLAQIVPTTNDGTNQRVMTYNQPIPGIVESRAAEGQHIIMVDMWTAFTDDGDYKNKFMNDELHPNDAGYVVMANVWYDAVGELLPE